MTAQTLYNKLNAGEITKQKFLYEIRKQSLPNITKFNTFADTIKILKNKRVISESEEKTIDLPTVDSPTIDQVSPWEYQKGINFELKLDGVSIINNLPTEAEIQKAQKKVLKNLGKDQYYYSRKLMSDDEKKLEKANEREYELTKSNTIHNKKKGIMREAAYKHPDSEVEDSFSLTHLVDTINEDHEEDDYDAVDADLAELEIAKEEAQRISDEEGVAQHVNKLDGGGYRVEDWYDSESTVASYEAGRMLESDSTSPWNDSDYETEDDDIEILLNKYNLDRNWFDKHIIDLDGLNDEELEDIEYIEDRIQAHLSFQGANVSTPSDDAMNYIDDEEELEESITTENPEWRSIIEDIIGEWGLVSFDMSDEDVMDEVEKEVKRRVAMNENSTIDESTDIDVIKSINKYASEYSDYFAEGGHDDLANLFSNEITSYSQLEPYISEIVKILNDGGEEALATFFSGLSDNELNEYGDEDKGTIETSDENQAKKLADQGKNVVLKDED